MKNFAYFAKPISKCTDEELLSWYISFMNEADFNDKECQHEYEEFYNEKEKRGEAFQNTVSYIDCVL